MCRQLKNAVSRGSSPLPRLSRVTASSLPSYPPQQGYETQVANNGVEALEAFDIDARTDRSIKVCLCDIQSEFSPSSLAREHSSRLYLVTSAVPVLDGLSAVRILRQKEKDGEINRRYVSLLRPYVL